MNKETNILWCAILVGVIIFWIGWFSDNVFFKDVGLGMILMFFGLLIFVYIVNKRNLKHKEIYYEE